jgi:hypothetical protein
MIHYLNTYNLNGDIRDKIVERFDVNPHDDIWKEARDIILSLTCQFRDNIEYDHRVALQRACKKNLPRS